MDPFARVVVGLDGSPASRSAWQWIVGRLPKGGVATPVHALSHADDTPPADLLVGDAAANVEVRTGDPADVLRRAALDHDASAIVVGPHGAGRRRTLGRVARELLRESPAPLIVVDGVDTRPSSDEQPPVIACIGFGEPSEIAARWAARYAASRDLPLVLLHAVALRPLYPLDSPIDMFGSLFGPEVSEEGAQLELDLLAEELTDAVADLEVSTHVDRGSAIRSVMEAGDAAELVVLGSRSRELFHRKIVTPRLAALVARGAFPTAVVAEASADS